MQIFDFTSTIATVLLSIVAIIIAIRSSRQTSKDASRQIESIKQLSKLQIDAAIKQMDVEILKNKLLAQQTKEEWQRIQDINSSGLAYQTEWCNEMIRQNKERKPQNELDFYTTFLHNLDTIRRNLIELKENLN